MSCTIDKLLEALDVKILKAQKNIDSLKKDLNECIADAEECRKTVSELRSLYESSVKCTEGDKDND